MAAASLSVMKCSVSSLPTYSNLLVALYILLVWCAAHFKRSRKGVSGGGRMERRPKGPDLAAFEGKLEHWLHVSGVAPLA